MPASCRPSREEGQNPTGPTGSRYDRPRHLVRISLRLRLDLRRGLAGLGPTGGKAEDSTTPSAANPDRVRLDGPVLRVEELDGGEHLRRNLAGGVNEPGSGSL